METIDEEFLKATSTSSTAPQGEQTLFCLVQYTRMHVFTHLKPASQGKTGIGIYPDGMLETDGM